MAICYKCRTTYESSDPSDLAGDGWCPPCKEQKALIAEQIDAKMKRWPEVKPQEPLDYYESMSGGVLVRTYTDKKTKAILGK